MEPTVSVIMPSLNQARFLPTALESVLGQDLPGVEVFVADGGSTDGSEQILRSHGDRVRYVHESDLGQSHAVNKGLSATTAPVVGWLNSDDLYLPGALSRVWQVFQGRPEVDIVYGQADHVDADGQTIGPYPTHPFDAGRLRRECFLCQPATFFRRRLIDRVGPLNEANHLCMDYELWLRAARAGATFHYLPAKLAASRLHGQTKTLSRRVEAHEAICAMLREQLGTVPGWWLVGLAKVRSAGQGREASPACHAMATLAGALRESVRYNGRVTPDVLGESARWVARHLSPRRSPSEESPPSAGPSSAT